MKKYFPYIIVLLIAAGIFGYMQYNKPHRDIAAENSNFTMTANELFDAFENDETNANGMFLDKVISVSGKIIDIAANQDGKNVITLEAENALLGGVLCTLKEDDETLKIDENAVLKCRCTGFLSDVILVDCTVEK